MRAILLRRFVPVVLLLLLVSPGSATPLGSAITYQGDLEVSGSPVTGSYDFTFALYNAASAGTQVGTTQTVLNLAVTHGLFSTPLDFGSAVFDGSALWMQVSVRTAGSGSYTPMTTRQALTAAPYALRALNGAGAGSQWNSDGPDLTYSAGGVGVLGTSSPFASGKGVFIEGGNASYGSVYAFNYDTWSPVSLCLNPTVNAGVGVGTLTPAAELDVYNRSGTGLGVNAVTTGSLFFPTNAAVLGTGNTGGGIAGQPAVGVMGQSTDAQGVYGSSTNAAGVFGTSPNSDGVMGQSAGSGRTGVWGVSYNASGFGGVFQNNAGGVALYAIGLAKVKSLQILGGADLAERFETREPAEPGTVMAIDPASPGRVCVAAGAYSHTVAGVVSGANGLSAGVEMAKDEAHGESVALALTGRVWVKCDAGRGAIRAGDLLTTADRPGFAMRAADHDRAQGAILGKAMTSLESGTGLVLVLVSLQ